MPLRNSVEAASDLTPSEAEAILTRLRGAIDAGASELGPILTSITEAAQAMTDASGAALALRCDGMVICRARSGEPAPELGVHLDEDSGISGECLRTGQMLRCEDAQFDHRVNPLVCRTLGLRSIAIAPLRRSGAETVGILETFSTRPYAFNEVHMGFLSSLAELAEIAQAREESKLAQATLTPPAQTAIELEVTDPLPSFAPAAAEPRTYDGVAPSLRARLYEGRSLGKLYEPAKRRLSLVVSATAVLALVAVAGWKIMDRPVERVTHRAAPEAPVAPPDTAGSEETLTLATPRPSPSHPRERSRRNTPASRRSAEKAAVQDVVTRELNSSSEAANSGDSSPAVASQRATSADITVVRQPRRERQAAAPAQVEPAPLVAATATGPGLGKELFAPATMPQLKVPVSQGVISAVLEHRVQPTYPQLALSRRVEGVVVLEATIAEDGSVKSLRVIQGPSILAQAATAAVRQWRYRPAMLDDKPVSAQTQITIDFRAPR